MIEIECEEPFESVCDCCGNTTVELTRFVYQDGDAFAVYYANFSENHPEPEIKTVISLGEWGEEGKPEDRRAFALIIRNNDLQYEVTVVNGDESPWQDVEIIGQILNRSDTQ